MLEKIARGLQKIIFPASSAVSVIGMLVLILMVLLTVTDVFARRFFDSPISGALSLSSLGLVLFVFLTLAYCAAKGGHVELGILTSIFPKRVQAGIAALMYILTSGILDESAKCGADSRSPGNRDIPIFVHSSFRYFFGSLGVFCLLP